MGLQVGEHKAAAAEIRSSHYGWFIPMTNCLQPLEVNAARPSPRDRVSSSPAHYDVHPIITA